MDPLLLAILVLLLIVALLCGVILLRQGRPIGLPPSLELGLGSLKASLDALPAQIRAEARESRDDLRSSLATQAQADLAQLEAMRREAAEGRARLEEAAQRNADSFQEAQAARLKVTNDAVNTLAERLIGASREAREEQRVALAAVTEGVGRLVQTSAEKQEALKEAISLSLDRLRKDTGATLEQVRATLEEKLQANLGKQDALRQTIGENLDRLRNENAEKLEQMRATVDEKLQGTLEKRLGESFALVSDRLEQVHKGLGEMQSLATGVGDLKRVLSNVKSRGSWGEVQLGALLEDMLTREQYATNVRIVPESSEVVEFAIRLPGRNGDDPLFLPIDAKFPHEDYDRLLAAQDSVVAEAVEKAGQALERAVRLQAKTIAEKYVHPPYSTDFAILYLPTEGLFAEVIRRPGLASELQSRYRIMVQGPTTLGALLTSLQMGFRTLAIEKRSSEVWKVLGAAKAEFEKYGQVWEKLGKQLDTARRTVEEAGKRTRAVSRRLRDVEVLEDSAPEALALIEELVEDEETAS